MVISYKGRKIYGFLRGGALWFIVEGERQRFAHLREAELEIDKRETA